MAITGMMMNKNFFVLLLTCTCLICSPFYGGVTPIAGSNVSNKPNFPPTLLHAFALPPYSCNAMGLFLLTEVSRNSSALPGVGSAEGGGNMCEGQERGISGVIRHSPPSISFQYEGCFRRMRESNPTVVCRHDLAGGASGNAQVSCCYHNGHPCDEHAVARESHLQDAPALGCLVRNEVGLAKYVAPVGRQSRVRVAGDGVLEDAVGGREEARREVIRRITRSCDDDAGQVDCHRGCTVGRQGPHGGRRPEVEQPVVVIVDTAPTGCRVDSQGVEDRFGDGRRRGRQRWEVELDLVFLVPGGKVSTQTAEVDLAVCHDTGLAQRPGSSEGPVAAQWHFHRRRKPPQTPGVVLPQNERCFR